MSNHRQIPSTVLARFLFEILHMKRSNNGILNTEQIVKCCQETINYWLGFDFCQDYGNKVQTCLNDLTHQIYYNYLQNEQEIQTVLRGTCSNLLVNVPQSAAENMPNILRKRHMNSSETAEEDAKRLKTESMEIDIPLSNITYNMPPQVFGPKPEIIPSSSQSEEGMETELDP